MPSLIDKIVSFALPPRCPICGVTVEEDHRFCLDCWQRMDFIQPPWCSSCGRPFPFALSADTICLTCIKYPPSHDGVRAVVAYDQGSGKLAMRLKYGARLGLAAMMARHLLPFLHDMPEDALIIPVPLHRWRLWWRGYNQSVLIGRELAKAGPQHLHLNILIRNHRTPPLRGMSARQRHRAVRRAFKLHRNGAERLSGKTIMLVDDVYTSGATANACATTLKRGGANKVVLFCWARSLRDGQLPA